MKVNVVFLVIALAIAGLIGYAFYSTNKGEANCVLLAIGSGCMIAASLSSSLAVALKAVVEQAISKLCQFCFF